MASYERTMRDGIEERTYPSGKRSFFLQIQHQGKRRWHKVPGPQNWTNARRYKAQVVTELHAGEYIDPEKKNLPLSTFIDRWWEACSPPWRANTRRHYRLLLTYLLPVLGEHRLAQIGVEDVQRLKVHLVGQGLAPATVRKSLMMLRQILARAVDWQYLTRSVATQVPLPVEPRPDMVVWDDDEIRRFLAVCPPRWELMFRVPLLTGLRLGETIAMRWRWVDWETSTYQVREQWSETTRALEPPKTAESESTIDLPPALLADLSIQQQSVRERQLRAREWWCQDGDLVFPSRTGTPTRSRSIYRVFDACVQVAGVPQISFHGLRHTFVSQLIRQGVNVKIIQRKARHRNIQVTLDRYGHLFPDDTATAAVELERRLFG